MALLPFTLPFAELEVGHHLYWQIGNLNLHGQVFLSSWILIGLLLALVLAGTRKLNRDPKGCLLYTSPSPRDVEESRMPSSA